MTIEEQRLNAELIRLQWDYDELYLELEHTKTQLRFALTPYANIRQIHSGSSEPVQLEFRF